MSLKSSAITLVLELQVLIVSSGASDFSILPNPNVTCHIRPCYTLSQVLDNPSQYFTSNTSAVFLPGDYANISGQLVIQNVHDISLVGDNPDNTIILCRRQFGLAFINITNLIISNLYFSMCGVQISRFTWKENIYVAEFNSFYRKYNRNNDFNVPTSLYLVHIINLNIHNVDIHNTKGVGILGVNFLGVSSIHKAVLVNNTRNFETFYFDSNYFSSLTSMLPSVQNITDSQFSFGSAVYRTVASGLNIIATQSTFRINIYITNVTTHNNTYANIHFKIKFGLLVSIQVKGIHCTKGRNQGLVYHNQLSHKIYPSLNQQHPECILRILDGYFDRNGISLATSGNCSVKLEHITVENTYMKPLSAGIYDMSYLVLKKVNISHNMDAVYIVSNGNSKVEFYGSNFVGNECNYLRCLSALSLTYCSVTFYGNTKFWRNKGRYGGAIYAEHSEINFQGNTTFLENEGQYNGGALSLYQNVSVVVEKLIEISFFRNYVQQSGGAIYARKSHIIVRSGGSLSFVQNKAYNGGAIAFVPGVDLHSAIYLEVYSQIRFVRNHAQHCGGAIYYVDEFKEDVDPKQIELHLHVCFYKLVMSYSATNDIINTINNIDVAFHNNTAEFAGTAIYGGWVDMCEWQVKWYTGIYRSHNAFLGSRPISVFDNIFHFSKNPQDLSLISSNPTRVCICINSFPDCSTTEYTVTAYPGETFTLSAVAVGQRFGTIPDIVQSSLVSGKIPALQRTQLVSATCTDLTYTVQSSPNRTEIMLLALNRINIPSYKTANQLAALDRLGEINYGNRTSYTEYYFPINQTLTRLQFQNLSVHIEVQFCPLGFVFNITSQTCICHPKLLENEINCSIDTQTVFRKSPIWINATFLNDTYTQVLVHNHCPFDYCKDKSIQLNMEHSDEQCAFSRSGVLCGSCQQNLSHVIGTSNCRECSSLQLLWMVPIFIVAGIVLVIFLMSLNITVSVGTINGLIFYANIVRANQAIFFPPTTSSSFLSIFIAWLNLDLGIETCFYNGLDAYVKTWLQFLFPIYIWTIVVIIIVSSHYSTTAAKLSGRNAVQVLATLFLLAYAKLLRITITAFSFTLLEYPDNYIKKIWLYDGNVEYLKGKHIALFLVAITLLLTISVPYTAALVFIQCLQRRSRYRILLWVWRLKPLFDAYTGPYKDKHRYWPGLLLVVRVVLFLVFSVNVSGNTAINLCAVAITTTCIMFYTVVNQGGIYKSRVLNAIEYSFFLNLSTLSIITLFVMLTDGDQTVVVYTSVSIAYITFMFILLYHIIWRVSSEQQRKRFTEWAITKLKVLIRRLCRRTSEENCQNVNPLHLPTWYH